MFLNNSSPARDETQALAVKAPSPNRWHVCILAQSCPVLHDPRDCSPPGSFVHGIFPARILEWIAISSSKGVIKYILLQLLLEHEYNKAEARGRSTVKVLQRAL